MTENYSVLRPEVLGRFDGQPLAQRNTQFLKTLLAADAVVIATPAGSHAALTPEAFAEKQKQCRALFEKWIRPEGFFRELWHHCSAD